MFRLEHSQYTCTDYISTHLWKNNSY
ncbi:hypothetical protein TBLA_0D00830 [Henningerozyma blattae CBS 6284]|uniref:Uncharacterized protein n=1 Tax=Henningerozyma blattae (strain ATCC 34711 / CBS 6284 / DSM 70876 / NBRC 10599 / NRRL Y-10934 / UCD 77-7) TaxID=1071380 RepID=I2H2I9_HENB6|nr:hypothetical protein TBLA_0D00830 [Tetrapisispora blattae CBS 6284]